MKTLLVVSLLLILVSACGTSATSHVSRAAQEAQVPKEPSAEVFASLLTRWNVIADGVTIPGQDPIWNFHWAIVDAFPHPTFRMGTDAAYKTFNEILQKFYATGDNVQFLTDNNLLTYRFKLSPNDRTSTTSFSDFSPIP